MTGLSFLVAPGARSQYKGVMHDRRTFLTALLGALAATAAGGQGGPGAIRKAILISMLPRARPYAERFALARDAGFDAIEMQTIAQADEAAEIHAAAAKAGI